MDAELVQHVTGLERRLDGLVLPERSLLLAAPFLQLPVLRGLWVASVNSSGNWYDLSGLGKMLTYNGNPTVNYVGLAPYWDYDGVGDYHSRLDEADLDITGTETYVAAAARGLTLGCWVYIAAVPVAQVFIASKLRFAADLSYFTAIFPAAGNAFAMHGVSGNGVAVVQQTSSNVMRIGAWNFTALRFVPGISVDVYLNGVKTSLLVGIPASVFSGAANFIVGGFDNGGGGAAGLTTGRIDALFLCAAALGDAQISALYQQTRAVFGV